MHDNAGRHNKLTLLSSGIILILAGLFFLFREQIFGDLSLSRLWPLFMLIPAIPLAADFISDIKKKSGNIIPLTILVFLMFHFLWHNFNGWEHSAVTWPNYLLAPGLGLLFFSLISGLRGPLVPAFILITLSAVFHVIIRNSSHAGALLFISAGIILVLLSFFRSKDRSTIQEQNGGEQSQTDSGDTDKS